MQSPEVDPWPDRCSALGLVSFPMPPGRAGGEGGLGTKLECVAGNLLCGFQVVRGLQRIAFACSSVCHSTFLPHACLIVFLREQALATMFVVDYSACA